MKDKLYVELNYKVPRQSIALMKDPRQVRTREALYHVMLNAIATTPFEDITIRQLTSGAGIAYQTFFRHYPSKEALLEDAAANEIRRLVELTIPMFDEHNLRATCDALCHGVKEDWELWRALLTGSAQPTIRQELLRASLLAAKRRTGGWPPQDLAIAIAVGVIFEILIWWLRQAEPPSGMLIAEIIYERAIVPGLCR